MTAYLVKRLCWAVLLFVALTMITFTIFFVLPSDEVRLRRGEVTATATIRDAIELHGPIYSEYGQFLWGIVRHGSLGHSFVNEREVTEILVEAAPVTASLVFGGVIVWMLIALTVGVVSAVRHRSLFDRTATVFVLLGISAHPVWIGLVLAYFVGYKLNLAPLTGYCDIINPSTECGGPVQWAYHLLLPWLTLAALFAALYSRMIRAKVLETMGDDFVRTARAKGASARRVMQSHVLRNAMLPVVTMLGMDAGLALGASLFVETVYGLPGLGRTAVGSLARRDLPVIMGVVIFTTIAIAVLNLIVDLLYAWLDPRIRVVGEAGS